MFLGSFSGRFRIVFGSFQTFSHRFDRFGPFSTVFVTFGVVVVNVVFVVAVVFAVVGGIPPAPVIVV